LIHDLLVKNRALQRKLEVAPSVPGRFPTFQQFNSIVFECLESVFSLRLIIIEPVLFISLYRTYDCGDPLILLIPDQLMS
jgi:hypothetical protein